MRKVISAAICAAAGIGLVAQGAGAAPGGPKFGSPILLTTDKGAGGYEPGITVDRFNNIVVTAHKQNHTLVLSPDSRGTVPVRSQSWLWTSKDGKTFTDMPGLTPLGEQNMEFGDEGDVAYDETGHIYFVDTNVTDNSFSRYKATGNGKLALETTRPVGPFGEPVDDRPWIAAHGDGVVLYAGNEGDSDSYPVGGSGDGDAYGPGRYTVYMSYDHGDTFDPLGVTLKDSGWCRPAADHRAGSKLLYVVCSNDGDGNGKTGTFWSYVSKDDGKNWSRYKMGAYDDKKALSWFSVTVAKDGTLYAFYTEGKNGGRLHLMTSKDHGQRWTNRDVTPAEGIYQYEAMDVAPDGSIGIAYYYRPATGQPWHVYAAVAKPGQRFVPTRVSKDPIASKSNTSPFGDFFEIAFGPDSKLNVVWTALNSDLVAEGLNSDIYFARQQ